MAATETTSTHFDVIVLGCGPAGERAAIQAAKAGKRVAVIERAHVVGGARINHDLPILAEGRAAPNRAVA